MVPFTTKFKYALWTCTVYTRSSSCVLIGCNKCTVDGVWFCTSSKEKVWDNFYWENFYCDNIIYDKESYMTWRPMMMGRSQGITTEIGTWLIPQQILQQVTKPNMWDQLMWKDPTNVIHLMIEPIGQICSLTRWNLDLLLSLDLTSCMQVTLEGLSVR